MKTTSLVLCMAAAISFGVAEAAVVSIPTAVPYVASFENSMGNITLVTGANVNFYRGSSSSGHVGYAIFNFGGSPVEFARVTTGDNYVAALAEGTSIDGEGSPDYVWSGGLTWQIYSRDDAAATPLGGFDETPDFIGFRVSDGAGGYNYGYLKGFVAADASTFTITDGAYETVVNQPISAMPVPEPSAALLGMVGLAAGGLMLRRRKHIA